MARRFAVIGAIAAGLAVAFGAFGAHGLKALVTPERLQTFETAVRYQMYHALALLFLGWLTAQHKTPVVTWAGYFFVAGIVIFSGSLYLLVLTDTPWLGAVTPFGGVAFISGWSLVVYALLKTRERDVD